MLTLAPLSFHSTWNLSYIYLLFLRLFQHIIQRNLHKIFGKLTTYVIDLFDLLVFFTITSFCRVMWDLYDLVALDDNLIDIQVPFILSTHFGIFIIFCAFGMTVNIYGAETLTLMRPTKYELPIKSWLLLSGLRHLTREFFKTKVKLLYLYNKFSSLKNKLINQKSFLNHLFQYLSIFYYVRF